jgi:hypothetical protein
LTLRIPASEHGVSAAGGVVRSLLPFLRILVAFALALLSEVAKGSSIHWSPVTPPPGADAEGPPVVTPEGLLFGGSVLALLGTDGTASVYADSSTALPGSSATFTEFVPEEYHAGRSVLVAFDSAGRRSIQTVSHASGSLSQLVIEGDVAPGSGAGFRGMREPRIGGAGVVFLGGPDPTPLNEELYFVPSTGGSVELVTGPGVPDPTPYDTWHAVGDQKVFFAAGPTSTPGGGLWSWRAGGPAVREVRNTVIDAEGEIILHSIAQSVVEDAIGDTVYFTAAGGSASPLRTASHDGSSLTLLTVGGIAVQEIIAMDEAGNMLISDGVDLYAYVDGQVSRVPLDDETFGAPVARIDFHQGSLFHDRIAAFVSFEDPERPRQTWLAMVPEPPIGALVSAVLAALALTRLSARTGQVVLTN